MASKPGLAKAKPRKKPRSDVLFAPRKIPEQDGLHVRQVTGGLWVVQFGEVPLALFLDGKNPEKRARAYMADTLVAMQSVKFPPDK